MDRLTRQIVGCFWLAMAFGLALTCLFPIGGFFFILFGPYIRSTVVATTVAVLFLLPVLVTCTLIFRISRSCGRHAKRHFGNSRYDSLGRVLEVDHRVPILYLRSFDDDEKRFTTQFWGDDTFSGSYEEFLCELFSDLGPLIAIGDPSDGLPQLGADRLYVGDTAWQSKVAELMSSCYLIALLVGDSPGLLWEFQASAEMNILSKTVLVFPPIEQPMLAKRWKAWLELAEEKGDWSLPSELPGYPLMAFFFRFPEGVIWRCQVITGISNQPENYREALKQLLMSMMRSRGARSLL